MSAEHCFNHLIFKVLIKSLHLCFRHFYKLLPHESFSDILSQNLLCENKFFKILYQLFNCPKTNFRLLVMDKVIHQMLIIQLQEAIQEFHSIINDFDATF